MRAGDTFFLTKKAVDEHLWVIISDPEVDAERVLFVSMTSFNATKEDVCLIRPGEHPLVSHETCVAYHFAKVTKLADLTKLKDAGHLEVKAPVSEALLLRIRRGVSLSRRIRFDHVELLLEQGLLD